MPNSQQSHIQSCFSLVRHKGLQKKEEEKKIYVWSPKAHKNVSAVEAKSVLIGCIHDVMSENYLIWKTNTDYYLYYQKLAQPIFYNGVNSNNITQDQ